MTYGSLCHAAGHLHSYLGRGRIFLEVAIDCNQFTINLGLYLYTSMLQKFSLVVKTLINFFFRFSFKILFFPGVVLKILFFSRLSFEFFFFFKVQFWKYYFFPGSVLKIFFPRFSFENIIFFQVQFWKKNFFSGSVFELISQQPWKHKAAATLINIHKLLNNCSLKKYISKHKYKNYVNLCEFINVLTIKNVH